MHGCFLSLRNLTFHSSNHLPLAFSFCALLSTCLHVPAAHLLQWLVTHQSRSISVTTLSSLHATCNYILLSHYFHNHWNYFIFPFHFKGRKCSTISADSSLFMQIHLVLKNCNLGSHTELKFSRYIETLMPPCNVNPTDGHGNKTTMFLYCTLSFSPKQNKWETAALAQKYGGFQDARCSLT